MNEFSIIEKIKILAKVISSSPFFLLCVFFGIFLILFSLLCFFLKQKPNKLFLISGWVALIVLLVIVYKGFFINLFDNLVNNVFMALYFPNLSIYVIIIAISNFFFIYSLVSKKVKGFHKTLNITSSISIDLLLILIVDVINRNNINVYEALTVYSNSYLLVLLEFTTSIFASWILLNIFTNIYEKLKKYDDKEYPKMQEFNSSEIIFD